MFAGRLRMLVLALVVVGSLGHGAATEQQAVDAPQTARVLWTESRVQGTPDPPLPFLVEPVFTALTWDRPLYVKPEPGTPNLLVILQGGEQDKPAKILRIEDRDDVSSVEVVLELPGRLIYGLEFDPHYQQNGLLYIFSNGPTVEPERHNAITRYEIRGALGNGVAEPTSALDILTWRSMGHDGGDLCFGNDGMLYATSGDGTSDSDNWLSAQDPSNLLGGVLRLDVREANEQQPYRIPADNPFVDLDGARGELWAIGLRNPWRMSCDPVSGQIWVGNNGQDLWETAHLMNRGDNFGWSVYEGSHPFYASRTLGPGTLVLPTVEHHHREARSLTGGVVYRGDRFASLQGAYIYGDYSTGKIWGALHDGERLLWHKEIADSSLQIAGFSNSHRGDLLIVDHAGGIFRLQENPQKDTAENTFPKRLSETGVFASVSNHQPTAGVLTYSINADGWNDGATAERLLGLPGESQIDFTREHGWNLPEGSVVVQTLTVNVSSEEGTRPRRIESRLLTRQQGEWNGYSYLWNEAQDDAVLVDRDGMEIAFDTIDDTGQSKQQVWRVPSRAECMSCHSRAVNYLLGLTEQQANYVYKDAREESSQLEAWQQMGLFSSPLPMAAEAMVALVDPHDESADLQQRVKSYLHTNCASCHVQAGGGNSRMELSLKTPLEEMGIVGHFPQHDSFGIARPQIINPGLPEQSVMVARLNRRGRGQMPPLVSNQVDQAAVKLFAQWIRELPIERPFVRNWTVDQFSLSLEEALSTDRSLANGKQMFRAAGCAQCHRIEEENAGIGPNLAGLAVRMKPQDILRSIIHPSEQVAPQYAMTVLLTDSGEVIQGRIEQENDNWITIRGQSTSDEPRKIAKESIEERRLSTTSTMPEGTLNHLSENEIYDLIAYLLSVESN